METLPLATVRNQLSALVDRVATTHDVLTVTRNGTPAVVVLAHADYESMLETLALVNDPVDQARLAEAESSLAAGDVTAEDEMGQLMADRLTRAARPA